MLLMFDEDDVRRVAGPAGLTAARDCELIVLMQRPRTVEVFERTVVPDADGTSRMVWRRADTLEPRKHRCLIMTEDPRG